jgi:LacI family transcriptional regulator
MSRGVQMLIDEIRRRRANDPAEHPHTLLDFELIRRQSDAAPRRRPRPLHGKAGRTRRGASVQVR